LHHWNNTNKGEVIKLIVIHFLQGIEKNLTTCIFARKILEMPIFLELFTKRFHLLLTFLHFFDNERYEEVMCDSTRLYKLKSILDHLSDRFRNVYTPECEVSVD
jgi:hypothetical protein